MTLKEVIVTNPQNVIVQIPAYVVNDWMLQQGEFLEVRYSENVLSIYPVRRRRYAT